MPARGQRPVRHVPVVVMCPQRVRLRRPECPGMRRAWGRGVLGIDGLIVDGSCSGFDDVDHAGCDL
eukprot:5575168-Prymnesium_polylepis.1